MYKLTAREKTAYIIGAGKAGYIVSQFHKDNMCNLGRGSDGCYCLELQAKIEEFWKAGLANV
jgi:hypothetical protein